VSSEKFSHICRHYFPRWKERLFSHPLWQDLGSGQATQAQFVGWLLESYHFIEGVNDRLALAVAECHDLRVRAIFAHHYTEEYDHAKFFIESLKALGLDEATIFSARPLPSTLAILNFMRQCARRDPLQYAVCSGFLESTGTDRIRARTFYASLSEHYSADKTQVIDPLVDHVGLDEEYGHNNLLESIVEILGDVPTKRASEALEAGAMLVETLELWSTDIQRNYDQSVFSTRSTKTYYRPPVATRGHTSA
jgi:pyrroloquinoline quinone (PQQ) biosynthesis protein C